MRDRGFLAVRKLGEFARVARLVGGAPADLAPGKQDDAGHDARVLVERAAGNTDRAVRRAQRRDLDGSVPQVRLNALHASSHLD